MHFIRKKNHIQCDMMLSVRSFEKTVETQISQINISSILYNNRIFR